MAELEGRLASGTSAEIPASGPGSPVEEGAGPGSRGAGVHPVDSLSEPDREPGIDPEAAAEGGAANGEAPPDDLPPAGDLVNRLRPDVRAALEEIFRVEWTGVKRLRPEDLKNA